jgi:S-adenosylmethionine:tRNA ribosyltransferase-isomerase
VVVQLSDIDYTLPDELIAQKPIEPRDSSRLLVDQGALSPLHRHMSDFDQFVQPGDVMVVNDTRVLPARLQLQRSTGGAAEVLLLEALSPDHGRWEALIRPARKLKTGEVLEYFGRRVVRIGERRESGDTFEVEILDDHPDTRIDLIGTMPLPPYIKRSLEDRERYQTVYSREPGSAAAPTAGLHFTDELLQRVEARGATIARVELVVGLDTFKPVTAQDPTDHQIHTERYRVPQDTWDLVQNAKRVIAIGTTATRALESAATFGELEGRTSLFVTRGYDWKVVDLLLTNFHMPRTSLLLLIDAFIGDRWRRLYEEAISQRYRFLSFGDAMLLDRHLDNQSKTR